MISVPRLNLYDLLKFKPLYTSGSLSTQATTRSYTTFSDITSNRVHSDINKFVNTPALIKLMPSELTSLCQQYLEIIGISHLKSLYTIINNNRKGTTSYLLSNTHLVLDIIKLAKNSPGKNILINQSVIALKAIYEKMIIQQQCSPYEILVKLVELLLATNNIYQIKILCNLIDFITDRYITGKLSENKLPIFALTKKYFNRIESLKVTELAVNLSEKYVKHAIVDKFNKNVKHTFTKTDHTNDNEAVDHLTKHCSDDKLKQKQVSRLECELNPNASNKLKHDFLQTNADAILTKISRYLINYETNDIAYSLHELPLKHLKQNRAFENYICGMIASAKLSNLLVVVKILQSNLGFKRKRNNKINKSTTSRSLTNKKLKYKNYFRRNYKRNSNKYLAKVYRLKRKARNYQTSKQILKQLFTLSNKTATLNVTNSQSKLFNVSFVDKLLRLSVLFIKKVDSSEKIIQYLNIFGIAANYLIEKRSFNFEQAIETLYQTIFFKVRNNSIFYSLPIFNKLLITVLSLKNVDPYKLIKYTVSFTEKNQVNFINDNYNSVSGSTVILDMLIQNITKFSYNKIIECLSIKLILQFQQLFVYSMLNNSSSKKPITWFMTKNHSESVSNINKFNVELCLNSFSTKMKIYKQRKNPIYTIIRTFLLQQNAVPTVCCSLVNKKSSSSQHSNNNFSTPSYSKTVKENNYFNLDYNLNAYDQHTVETVIKLIKLISFLKKLDTKSNLMKIEQPELDELLQLATQLKQQLFKYRSLVRRSFTVPNELQLQLVIDSCLLVGFQSGFFLARRHNIDYSLQVYIKEIILSIHRSLNSLFKKARINYQIKTLQFRLFRTVSCFVLNQSLDMSKLTDLDVFSIDYKDSQTLFQTQLGDSQLLIKLTKEYDKNKFITKKATVLSFQNLAYTKLVKKDLSYKWLSIMLFGLFSVNSRIRDSCINNYKKFIKLAEFPLEWIEFNLIDYYSGCYNEIGLDFEAELNKHNIDTRHTQQSLFCLNDFVTLIKGIAGTCINIAEQDDNTLSYITLHITSILKCLNYTSKSSYELNLPHQTLNSLMYTKFISFLTTNFNKLDCYKNSSLQTTFNSYIGRAAFMLFFITFIGQSYKYNKLVIDLLSQDIKKNNLTAQDVVQMVRNSSNRFFIFSLFCELFLIDYLRLIASSLHQSDKIKTTSYIVIKIHENIEFLQLVLIKSLSDNNASLFKSSISSNDIVDLHRSLKDNYKEYIKKLNTRY